MDLLWFNEIGIGERGERGDKRESVALLPYEHQVDIAGTLLHAVE